MKSEEAESLQHAFFILSGCVHLRKGIREPRHACCTLQYRVVLYVDDCTLYERWGSESGVVGKKKGLTKIEYELSSAAWLSVAAHFALNQPQRCLSCLARRRLQFQESLCISGRWEKE